MLRITLEMLSTKQIWIYIIQNMIYRKIAIKSRSQLEAALEYKPHLRLYTL